MTLSFLSFRPEWDESTTPEELAIKEREAFLNWRRNMAMYVGNYYEDKLRLFQNIVSCSLAEKIGIRKTSLIIY